MAFVSGCSNSASAEGDKGQFNLNKCKRSKQRIPSGCFAEEFTGNRLIMRASDCIRKSEVMQTLNLQESECTTGNADESSQTFGLQSLSFNRPVRVSFKKVLSFRDDKLEALDSIQFITFVVPWHRDPLIRQSLGNEKHYASWRITDLRDRFATLHIFGDGDELHDVLNWRVHQLWAIKGFRLLPKQEKCDRILTIQSPAHVLRVGSVYGVRVCAGQAANGGTCVCPIDSTFHERFCGHCEGKLEKSQAKAKQQVVEMQRVSASRRCTLDPFADMSERPRKMQKRGETCSVNNFEDAVMRSVLETAKQLSDYITHYRIGEKTASKPDADVLKRIIGRLLSINPAGEIMNSTPVTKSQLLANLEISVSFHRHVELGLEADNLRRILKHRRDKCRSNEISAAKQMQHSDNKGNLKATTARGNQNSHPQLTTPELAFDNLQKVAEGKVPERQPEGAAWQTCAEKASRADSQPSEDFGLFKSFKSSTELRNAIEKCLASRTTTDLG